MVVTIEKSMDTEALYDNGSNVSMINKRFLKKLNENIIINNYDKSTFRVIRGERETEGAVLLNLTCFGIVEKVRFFVIEDEKFRHDILIGINIIKVFPLCQDENLKIYRYEGSVTEYDTRVSTIAEINFNEFVPNEQLQAKIDHLDQYKKKKISKLIDEYDCSRIFAKNRYDI